MWTTIPVMHRHEQHPPERGGVHPLLTGHFSVFRRAQNERDVEDPPRLVPPVIERYGLLPEQVRFVSWSSTARVWVTPGSHGLALSQENVPAHGRGTHFASAESACSRGAWGMAEDLEGRRWLVGLVPDSNEVVEWEWRGDASKTVHTVEGVWSSESSTGSWQYGSEMRLGISSAISLEVSPRTGRTTVTASLEVYDRACRSPINPAAA